MGIIVFSWSCCLSLYCDLHTGDYFVSFLGDRQPGIQHTGKLARESRQIYQLDAAMGTAPGGSPASFAYLQDKEIASAQSHHGCLLAGGIYRAFHFSSRPGFTGLITENRHSV